MGNSFPELAKKRIAAGIGANDIAAVVLYGGLASFLCLHTGNTDKTMIIFAASSVAAAWGAYFVSRRWINGWMPSLFAGAVYGFGPFSVSFEMFHPLTGAAVVMVPWLLLPSVYWHKSKSPSAVRFMIRAVLALLPFAGIGLLFWTSSQPWAGPIFLMPKDLAMNVEDFAELIFPLRQTGGFVEFGLYHCSTVTALMGLFVYYKLKRIAFLIPIAAGLILSFCEPVLQVSPIVWAAFPILFLSMLSGLGFQAMVYAGKADSKWVATCAVFASILAAFFGAMSVRIVDPFRLQFEVTAVMYAMTAAAIWITVFCIHKFPRHQLPRWIILTAVMAIDLVYSARYLMDVLF